MTPRDKEIAQRTADKVSAKLQDLYDSCAEEEKQVLETILASVAEPVEADAVLTGRQVSLEVTGIRHEPARHGPREFASRCRTSPGASSSSADANGT